MHYKKFLINKHHELTEKFRLKYQNYKHVKDCYAEIFPESELENFPELLKEFAIYNLEIDVFKIFVTSPNYSISPHIDGNNVYPKYWALNWPLFNCQDTFMHWYKVQDNATSIPLINDNRYTDPVTNIIPYRYDIKDCIEIDRLELVEPHLVDIHTVHNVSNPSAETSRVVLSFRFKPEPLHLIKSL